MGASRLSARSPPAVGLFIRFLFIGSRLCSTLLSDPASRRRPCASLSLHLHQVVKRTFTSQLSNMLGTPKNARAQSAGVVSAAVRSEGVLQSQLNDASRKHGSRDLANIARDVVNVRAGPDGRNIEHRVIEDVEEVSPEQDLVPLLNVELLEEREVPVLLKRPTVDVTLAISAPGRR